MLLSLAFAPAILGDRTLLHASWDAPSIVSNGAYESSTRPKIRLQRTPDPGASAWQTEAWFPLISKQLWTDFTLPLWNEHNSFGGPLAASALPQPFYPLTILLSLSVTPWTYNLFLVARLFVGGLLTYFFAAQFLTRLPSLFAAVVFMLSGYFILFLGISHLSVETLTPGVVLAFEWLARKNSWSAAAGVAGIILLGMTGGMPESLFVILAFGAVYFVSRIVFTPTLRTQAVPLLLKFVAAVVLGFAVSAFMLLPLLEFLSLGYDVHQPSNIGNDKVGLVHDDDPRLLIQYLLPLILGPVLNSTLSNFAGWSGLKGYWGIIPFFFAVIALLAMRARARAPQFQAWRFLTVFFSAMLAAMLLKRFGSVTINWIGYLPVSELVLYPKYLEPVIAFCAAMLGGLGFAAFVERTTTRTQLLLAAAATLAVMLVLAGSYLPSLGSPSARYASTFFFASVASGVAVVAGTALIGWIAMKVSPPWQAWAFRGLVAALALELTFNFLVPGFYVLNKLPPATASPYAGAPYIDFIKQQNKDRARVFGRENMLYPNWSAAFGIDDVRSLTAIHYVRYRSFIRNFLLPPNDDRRHGDLADRFTGQEFTYPFDTETEKRFLALASVKYLLTDSEYGVSAKVVDEIIRQHQDEFIWGFGPEIFSVGDPPRRMRGVFQHAPSSKVSLRTMIDPRKLLLEGVATLKDVGEKSDGADFHIELRQGERTETLFHAFLDPFNVPADRSGRAFRIDLGAHAAREVELLFSTGPGPKGDNKGDWAGWAGLRFVAHNGAPEPDDFKKIYDAEVRIYEVPYVFPRAALYRAIEVIPDDDVLARLKDPTFDPNSRAIVSRQSLPVGTLGIAELSQAVATPLRAAAIVDYQSQYVRIEADAAAPSLLVLNDANFPGWQAYLDGKPVPSVMANYLFRGVVVPAGKSIVEFRYQAMSYRAGWAIAVIALLVLAGLVLHERRQRRIRT